MEKGLRAELSAADRAWGDTKGPTEEAEGTVWLGEPERGSPEPVWTALQGGRGNVSDGADASRTRRTEN